MKRRAVVLVLVWAMLTLSGIALVNAYKQPKYMYSPYQPTAKIHQSYLDCKANAPKGFDCIMQPVMVSEAFIKEEGNK